jgi:hypothetical protein
MLCIVTLPAGGSSPATAAKSYLTADQCTCLQAKAKSDSFGAFLAAAALVGAVALHGPGSSEATSILSNKEAVALLSKYASVKALLQDHAAWQAETTKACGIKVTGGSAAEMALGILELDGATLCPATSGRNLLWSNSWLKDGLTIAVAFGVGVLEGVGGAAIGTAIGTAAGVFVTGLTIWTGPFAPAIGAAVGAAVACAAGIFIGELTDWANDKYLEAYIDDPDVRQMADAAATIGGLVNIGSGVRKAYKARQPLERVFDTVKGKWNQVKSQQRALDAAKDAANAHAQPTPQWMVNRIGEAESNVKGAKESFKRYMMQVGNLGSDAYDFADEAGTAAGEAVLGQSVTRPAGDASGACERD